jgi:predicted DNA-binding transcriptional regulator AlpA
MKTHSTVQVAKMLGVSSSTLWRWIVEGKLTAPPLQSVIGIEVRLWTKAHVEKARKYKAEHYWGMGGRKKRKKRSKQTSGTRGC